MPGKSQLPRDVRQVKLRLLQNAKAHWCLSANKTTTQQVSKRNFLKRWCVRRHCSCMARQAAGKRAVTGGPVAGRGMRGYYLGSGDRQEAIARLRRWVAIAEENLATEWIDPLASRIATYANDEAFRREGKKFDGKWMRQWEAEVTADRRDW